MKPFLLRNALQAIGGTYRGDMDRLDAQITSVTSDSRTAGPGALFVAFKGNRADGHDFMADCLGRGAVACVSEREPLEDDESALIVVESSLRAEGALAAWYRGRFDIPVIGVTGSVGKTTTKEMIAAVLSQKYQTHKTNKNFNNELGVPQTLLQLEEGHQVSVVEMGISEFGEMSRLTRMVRPSIAVFTVIGDAHLEFLGDRKGVLKAKSEIFEGMDGDGLAVLNGDDPLQASCKPGMRRITYGCSEACDVRGENIENLGEAGIRMDIRHARGAFSVHIPAYGGHMVYAALAASAVGLELGLSGEEIARGIGAYQTVGNRARVIHTGKLTILSDCYNSNPSSCGAALDSLGALKCGRRVCVLGDMLELGPESARMHAEVGERAARLGIELIIGCGPLAKHVFEGARDAGGNALYFEDKAALFDALSDIIAPDDYVLVKASLRMGFDEIVDRLSEMK